MSDKIHITKSGFQAMRWDGEAEQYVDRALKSFTRRLRDACHIEEGVTLGDIFRAVDQDQDIVDFLADYSWCDVRAFHAEALRAPLKKSDLEYLRLSKLFEFDENEGSVNLHFCGIGKPDAHGITTWSVGLSPMCDLAHLPVTLDPKMEIYRHHQKIGETKSWFSLLEVLSEIYWDISFYGGPEKRDATGQELLAAMQEVKSGTAKLKPWPPPGKRVN